MISKNFKFMEGDSILITGGTGSFGYAAVEYLKRNFNGINIRIYSRDEEKQRLMREHFGANKIVYILGDIRDRLKLSRAMKGCRIVFHAASLKQVPSCDGNIDEFIKTNVDGSMNVGECAIANKVSRVVFLSTDKACDPVVTYGVTKLLAERYFIWANQYSPETDLIVTRYGNVSMSRGSVIPKFISNFRNGKISSVTSLDCTRFFMTLSEAVELVINATIFAHRGEIFIPILPSFTIETLVRAIMGDDYHSKINIIGLRGVEKRHESLMTEAEISRSYMLSECENTKMKILCILPEFEIDNPRYDFSSRISYPHPYVYSSGDFSFTREIQVDEMRGLIRGNG